MADKTKCGTYWGKLARASWRICKGKLADSPSCPAAFQTATDDINFSDDDFAPAETTDRHTAHQEPPYPLQQPGPSQPPQQTGPVQPVQPL